MLPRRDSAARTTMRFSFLLLLGSMFASTARALSDAELLDCFEKIADSLNLNATMSLEGAQKLNQVNERVFESYCYFRMDAMMENRSSDPAFDNSTIDGSKRKLQSFFPPQYPLNAEVTGLYSLPGWTGLDTFSSIINGLDNR